MSRPRLRSWEKAVKRAMERAQRRRDAAERAWPVASPEPMPRDAAPGSAAPGAAGRRGDGGGK